MSPKSTQITGPLHAYLVAHGVREESVLRKLREETSAHPWARMQISPDQGQFLRFLVRTLGATKTIEVGVFTGYSSLCVALALPTDGRILACDINPETTEVAKRYFAEAGISEKLDLRLGPAQETLSAALGSEGEESFDFAFIDADKENYSEYLELCLRLVKPGAVIAVDNVLWGGSVLDEAVQDPATQAIRDFNRRAINDERFDISMVPIADGLTLLRKRG